jgi:hypothetical protein
MLPAGSETQLSAAAQPQMESDSTNPANNQKKSSSEEHRTNAPRTATFFFKMEHRTLVESVLEDFIKSLCQKYLKVQEEKVSLAYGDVTKFLTVLQYPGPVFADTDTRFAVLLVNGISPAEVLKYKENKLENNLQGHEILW